MYALWILAALCAIGSHSSLATELCYIHKWNINCIEVADSGQVTTSKRMLDHSAVYPIGLSYGSSCHDGGKCENFLFFTETVLSRGTLLAVPVDDWHNKGPSASHDLKMLIKRDFNSPLPAKLEFDQTLKSVYVTSKKKENSIFSSVLSPDLSTAGAHPSLVMESPDAVIVDLSLDQCNRMLYWIEQHGNQTSLFRRSLVASGKSHSQKVLTSKPSSNEHDSENIIHDQLMKTVHYDQYSNSLFIAFTSPTNVTTFGRIAPGSPLEMLSYSFHPSYPYDLTSDEKYLYWTDWELKGLMRVAKSGHAEEPIIRLANTTAYTHKETYQYPGAMEVVVLEDPRKMCVVNEAKTNEKSTVNEVDHSMTSGKLPDTDDAPKNEVKVKHVEIQADDQRASTKAAYDNKHILKKDPLYTNTRGASSLLDERPFTASERYDIVTQDLSTDSPVVYTVVSKDAFEASIMDTQEDTIRIWGKLMSGSEVSALLTFLLIATLLLCVIVGVLLCARCSISPNLFKSSSHVLVDEQMFANEDISAEGSNDVLVDLTNAEKHTSVAPAVTFNTRPKKKVFRPNKDKIGCLIPKPPTDGVTINIEDCCQMTLCETPCFTSVKKTGRRYLSTSSNCDQKMLLSDPCHTSC